VFVTSPRDHYRAKSAAPTPSAASRTSRMFTRPTLNSAMPEAPTQTASTPSCRRRCQRDGLRLRTQL